MTYEDTYRDTEKYFFAKAVLGLYFDNEIKCGRSPRQKEPDFVDVSYVRASIPRALDFVKEYEYRRDHKRGPKKSYIEKNIFKEVN